MDTHDEFPRRGSEKGQSPSHPTGWWRRFLKTCRANLGKTTFAGLALLFILVLFFADALLAGPMRNWAERMMNSQLNGYTVHIGGVRPHIWRLGFDLDDLVLVQNSHPTPPVADFGALKFSIVWADLLRLKVTGDLTIERPALHINLTQIEDEAKSHVSLKDRGWQKAVESIYPIKLDQVKVIDGSLLYLSSGTASKPLQLTKVFMLVKNVRNIATVKGTYPSPVIMEGVLFDAGKVWFKGAADFFRIPYTAVHGEIRLERVPLDRLNPLAQDYQMKTTGGFLSANGSMEYTPEAQTVHLTDVLFEKLQVDYVTSKATKAIEKEHGKQVVAVAKKVRNAPQLLLQVDALRLTNSQIGFVSKSAKPPYRLFISDVNLKLENLSNHANQGSSKFHARGVFMGSGATVVWGEFRTTARPADFDVHLQLDDAKLRDLNRFLMAYAGVDVAEGLFSVYTEITVKDGKVHGYLKPLLKNLKIYDKQKDQNKRFLKRVEMHALQFLAYVFKNRSTQKVATVIRISGSTSDPQASEWEAIRRLIGNGFYQAVLPGFLDKSRAVDPPKPVP
jgi:hypothetical protein